MVLKTTQFKQVLSLLIFIGLTACATSKPIYDKDGNQAHLINCSAAGLTWGNCYEKASQQCGSKGYTTIEKDTDEYAGAVGNSGGVFANKRNNRIMVIRCK